MNSPSVTNSHIGNFGLANRSLQYAGRSRAHPGVFVCMCSASDPPKPGSA